MFNIVNGRVILSRIPAVRRAISTTLPVSYPIVVRMPALSPTMTEGTIVSWVKSEGEGIVPGDSLCEIQTDKAVMTMDIEEEGVLAKILKKDGSSLVSVGQPIAVIAEDGEDWQSLSLADLDLDPGSSPDPPADSASHSRQSRDAEFPPLRDLASLKLGPAVRLLLDLYRLRPSDIEVSGHRILKGDVLAHITAKGLKPQPQEADAEPDVPAAPKAPVVKATPPSGQQRPSTPSAPPQATPTAPALSQIAFRDVQLSVNEAAAAKLTSISKRTIPHNYVSLDVTLNHVVEVAKRAHLPVSPFILKAAAVALQSVPEANSFLKGDGVSIGSHPVIDVAVVSKQHPNSAPCLLRSLDCMTCVDIANKLAAPVKENASSDAASTATFTVVDLTDSEVSHLAAVVVPPQAAVLAIGGVSTVLSPETDGPRLQHKATVTLSVDVRVLDESVATRYLSAFASALEVAVVGVPGVNLQKDPLDDLLGLGLD